jgi:hypothetical protein
MNGAEKIINAMKKVNNSNQPTTSEIVSLTVESLNPLTFQSQDRLSITKDFYTLSKVEDWTQLSAGDIVRAFKMNSGQNYYINEIITGESKSDTVKSLQEQIKELADRVTALENKIQ